MDSVNSRSIALFSIHSGFANALLDRTKCVEFRKTRLPSSLQTIVIYATAPVGAIIGYVTVAKIVESTPQLIWKKYGSIGGIRKTDYFDYFLGSDRAIAIEVLSAYRFPVSQPLSAIEVNRAPQSFQYLDQVQLNTLTGFQRTLAA